MQLGSESKENVASYVHIQLAEFQNKDKLAPQFRERLATLSLLSPAPAQHALGLLPAAGGSDRPVHAGAEPLALPQLRLVLRLSLR